MRLALEFPRKAREGWIEIEAKTERAEVGVRSMFILRLQKDLKRGRMENAKIGKPHCHPPWTSGECVLRYASRARGLRLTVSSISIFVVLEQRERPQAQLESLSLSLSLFQALYPLADQERSLPL